LRELPNLFSAHGGSLFRIISYVLAFLLSAVILAKVRSRPIRQATLYLSATGIDPQHAELQFRIARCLWALGDFAGAKDRFVRAQDLDTLRFRADSRLNEVIRGLSGVGIVDGAAVLAAESEHDVPGSELFYEHARMNPRGTYLLARAYIRQLDRMLPAELRRGAVSADIASEEECERLLAFTPYDRSSPVQLAQV
jgi:hypothetical protein